MGTHPIFESDFDCLTDMKARFRLVTWHYAWMLSLALSFYYGTRVRKCAINYDYQSANLYQRRMNQPLRLFGAIRPSHYQVLGQLFSQVNPGDFNSLGSSVWTQFALHKSYTWFTAEKEKARLNQAGCSKFVVSEAVIESIISCGLSNDDPAPIYESGKLYYFSQYSSIFARYNELDEQGVDPSEIFNLDKGFKDSKRLSMHGMEKELTEGLQTNFKKTSKMANLKYLIVVQHPRQYALEVANERSDLPDSELYLTILSEWVKLMTFLVKACEEINDEFKSGCAFVRIEDIIRYPAKTFQIPQLSTPAITHSIDYEEIPVFEKDIEEILYSNKKVKHFIQKYQYHGLTPDFGDTVIPIAAR